MFEKRKWEVTDSIGKADLIQFTGGSDVHPSLYGQLCLGTTTPNLSRDRLDAAAYAVGLKFQVPMAGICRGGQFLNVMEGGKLVQDIDEHNKGAHQAECHMTGISLNVTSTHHQMMLPAIDAEVLMTARVSNTRRGYSDTCFVVRYSNVQPDVEALFYTAHNVLCFQPHPEYRDIKDPLQDLYFFYLETLCMEQDHSGLTENTTSKRATHVTIAI